ncbi:MAG: VOC family protein [Bryobacterales bacterium]|nr:VOC family protein [Bryobacterales bacterium]
MYKGIEHTAIAAREPEALAGWYAQNLEMPIIHRYGGNVFVRASDGTMLEMIPSEGAAPEAGMRTPGIRHLAIKADDFDEAVRDLEGKGIKIVQFVEAGPNRLAFFLDPEGNILHLIDRGDAPI